MSPLVRLEFKQSNINRMNVIAQLIPFFALMSFHSPFTAITRFEFTSISLLGVCNSHTLVPFVICSIRECLTDGSVSKYFF